MHTLTSRPGAVLKRRRRNGRPPDNYLWTKTTDALTQLGTCSSSWEYSAGELLRKTTGTVAEFFLEVRACNFFQRFLHAGPYQKMLLLDCREEWMAWEHVTLPPLDNRQRPTGLDFLEQKIDEVCQPTICAIAVVVPWRLLCHEIVVVWNERIPLSTKIGIEDATRNDTSWLLEMPNQFQMRMPLATTHVDS